MLSSNHSTEFFSQSIPILNSYQMHIKRTNPYSWCPQRRCAIIAWCPARSRSGHDILLRLVLVPGQVATLIDKNGKIFSVAGQSRTATVLSGLESIQLYWSFIQKLCKAFFRVSNGNKNPTITLVYPLTTENLKRRSTFSVILSDSHQSSALKAGGVWKFWNQHIHRNGPDLEKVPGPKKISDTKQSSIFWVNCNVWPTSRLLEIRPS